jgi:hypothetical protein
MLWDSCTLAQKGGNLLGLWQVDLFIEKDGHGSPLSRKSPAVETC